MNVAEIKSVVAHVGNPKERRGILPWSTLRLLLNSTPDLSELTDRNSIVEGSEGVIDHASLKGLKPKLR
ncbi:MAG: hypothetical protein QOE35_3546 [Actinomycetota bacterium]